MDASSLGTLNGLNAITPFHFRSKAPLFRSIHFAQFKHKLHLSLSSPRFSPLCSLPERGEESSLPLPCGVGEAMAEEVSRRKLLQVVLVSPQNRGLSHIWLRNLRLSSLPPEALLDCKSGTFGGGTIRIPMVETNLSVRVGIALYEASRQLNYEPVQVPSENFVDTTEPSFTTEDIFA